MIYLVLFLLLALVSPSEGASGLIFRDSCGQIPNPEAGKTMCMQQVPPYALYVWDGSTWVLMAAATGGVLGSGTPPYIAVWTASDTLGSYAGMTCPGTTHVSFINPDGTAGCTDALPPGNVTGTFLVSGGGVTWVSGYTFRVSAASYYINGTLTTSLEQDVTLVAADPSNNRIDTIILDSAGLATSITGTAAAPPFEPSTDPLTQLRLTAVTVTAASVNPGITTTMIYDEGAGGEWTATPSAGTIVVGSLNNPYTGTKDIEGTSAVTNDEVVFVKPSGTIDLATQNIFVFYVRVKAAWPNNKRIRISWRIGTGQVGQFVDVANGQFGFNSQLTSSYQQIVIPANQWGVPNGTGVDQMVMRIVGGGAAVGFYWDTIQLQAGFSQNPQTIPGGPTGSIQYNNNGVLDGFGSWSGTQMRVPGQLVVDTRTGTPATFATFTVGGRLVEGAAYSTPGTVTSFSAGNLSPLFTSSVATATTTPALTFSLSTAADKTLFSNISGGVAAPSFNTIASVLDNQLGSTRGSTAIRGVSSWSSVPPGTSGYVWTSLGAGSDPAWVQVSGTNLPAAQTRRKCTMIIGADNGAVLVNADLGPQGKQCQAEGAATVVEVTVAADGGTPNVIVRRITSGGSANNLLSSALATAAAGAVACSNTGGTTGLDGSTICTNTLQNTSLAAGEWIELLSGTAGGVAKRMSVVVTYTIN